MSEVSLEPGRPSFEDGILILPAIDGYGSIALSHREDEGGGWVRFRVTLRFGLEGSSDELLVTRVVVDLIMTSSRIAHIWSDAKRQLVSRGELLERETIESEFTLRLGHDGFGHFVLWATLPSTTFEPQFAATVPILIEAAQLDRVAAMWTAFFAPSNEERL